MVYLYGENSHGCFVTHTLHAFEGVHKPHAWFAFDWFTRPQQGLVGKTIDSKNCREDEKWNCAPEEWQLAESCPFEDNSIFKFSDAMIAEKESHPKIYQQFTADDMKHGPVIDNNNGNQVVYLQHSREQLDANCKLARIPTISKIENNSEGYGIMGAHSFVVLVLFVALIFFAHALSCLMTELKSYGAPDNMYYWKLLSSTSMFDYFVIFLILAIFFARMLSDSVVEVNASDDSSKKMIRSNANSSYMYGLFHFILYAIFISVSRRQSKDSNENDVVLQAEVVGLNDQMYNEPGVEIGYLNSRALPKPGQITMPTQGLISLSTPNLSTPGKQTKEYLFKEKVNCSDWTVMQIIVLPLWLLILHTSSHGYVFDLKLQLIFLGAILFGLIDIYFCTYVKIRNAVMMANNDAMGQKERLSIGSSFLIVSIIQLVIVIVVNSELGLAYDNIAENDVSHLRARMDMTGVILFNVWVGISFLLKFMNIFYDNGLIQSSKIKTVFKDVDDITLFFFIVIVFYYLCHVLGHFYLHENYLLNPLTVDTETMGANVKNLIINRMKYSAKFQEI